MKKRILALLTVLAVLFSMLTFVACDNGSNDDGTSDDGGSNDNGDKNDSNKNGKLDLDESVNGGGSSSNGIYIISDPTNPEAGSQVEDKYSGDAK